MIEPVATQERTAYAAADAVIATPVLTIDENPTW
jgi:hypothetical protein